MNAEITTANLRDGAKVTYRRWGAGNSGGRILLVHPLALDGSLWKPVAARLAAARMDIIAPDCRGHGRSERSPGPYSVEQFADDLTDLMDHAGWANAIVAGCSMGGCVAQAFAGAYPQRLQGLVLVDTTSWYGPNAQASWAKRATKARTEGLASMSGFQTTRWFSEAYRADHPKRVAEVVDIFIANKLECYAASCAMLGAADLRSVLSRIRVPVQVVVGEDDYATPVAASEYLAREIPGARLIILPHARHLTLVERPDNIAAAIAEVTEASVS
ncbi:alpha/beta fold hydrolase [Chelativorans alearense]|uniref:alpha/beta fold hydrolase n=1 Tax=Chelativorans alearense TaxID=2681495 RepID=UPI0013D7D4FC|nr:alpha/beta hydrolase [Chelativorans alearense]